MIPDRLLAEVAAHARAAYPRECCGYMVGPREIADVDEAVACHNAAATTDAYAIDGAELVAFARSFASRRPPRVVYHSHTNGKAYISPRDREHALAGADHPAYPVQHLVIGVADGVCREAVLFAWDDAAHDFVTVARFTAQVLG